MSGFSLQGLADLFSSSRACMFMGSRRWAEHGSCRHSALVYSLWTNALVSLAAQNSKRQNGNRYVSVLQQNSGVGRLSDNYPQNQLRQASVQSSSFNTETAVSSGYSRGLSHSGYTQALSQPAKSGYASVRLVQSNSLSKPNWRVTKSKQVNAQKVPKKFFGLSTSIASGSSVSKYSKNQNDISKTRARPGQQGTVKARKYPASSSAPLQSASRGSKPASYQSAAQKAPAAADRPAGYQQKGYALKSSSLFGAGAAVPQRNPVRMQTSASAPAKRVPSQHRSKPSPFSNPQERTRTGSSQTEARKLQSKMFPVTGGNGRGSYKPRSSYSQSVPVSKQDAHSFQQSLATSTSRRLSYKPGYSSDEQIPSSTTNLAQGARNLPDSRKSRTRTSAQRFAPTRTHNIPERFGGYAIRRLKEPADKVSVRKPQQTYTAPSQQSVSNMPQVQSVHQQTKWKRMRPSGTIAGEYLIFISLFCP